MAVIECRPMKLPAHPWVEGYVLDYHTVSSTPTGDPYYRFDTKRTELGERLFRLKYRNAGADIITDIVDTEESFLRHWSPPVDCVVTAPPSRDRKIQPIHQVAIELAKRLGIPMCENAIAKVKETQQMKDIDDFAERQRVLGDAVQIGQTEVRDKAILLLDDLIESGATLRRSAEVLLKDGAARAIYALVLTRTK